MGSGLTIPEELNEEECRSLAKSAGVEFDHQRFISLATERNGDPTAEASVSRSQLIVDVSKAVSSRLRNEPADVIRKPRPPKKILLPELVDAFEQAFSAGLTPLILDPSPGHNADTFFRYSHTSILDAKRVGLDAALGTGSEAQGLEEARHALVQAMKRGKTLVVSMQQSSPPFSSWLRHPSFLRQRMA
mmetsp:Transcript_5430/g.11396  ORF Transcript_5430/g.11396 Transcript_5430/m.11396 type:complete len:189 (+) Transcript_5430:103-669(+)